MIAALHRESKQVEPKSRTMYPTDVYRQRELERENQVPYVERRVGWEAPDWYGLAHLELQSITKDVLNGNPPKLRMLEWIAAGMVESLKWSDRMFHRVFTSTSTQYLLTNPIHVSVISIRLGMGMGWAQHHLERLALGGFLHDIGMCLLPRSLHEKTGNLCLSERATLEQHPLLGGEVFRTMGKDYEWLANIIQQAHERRDGKGYPFGISGSDIHPYGYVIRLADVFDGLTGVRLHRKKMSMSMALRTILSEERRLFPKKLLKAFIGQMTIYPLGTWVKLNNGEVGRVTAVNRGLPLRPVILTTTEDRKGNMEFRLVDLRTEMWAHVTEVLG